MDHRLNFLIFASLLLISVESLETLSSVQVLFRHGEKELDGVHEIGGGPLTDKGKKQMFDLGTFLRSRYEGFVKIEFDSGETSFLSSDKDPVIQSASLVAYGLYLDFNLAATWSGEENIQYEPIPVRTLPRKYDNTLQLSKSCPKNDARIQRSLSEFSRNFISDNSDFLRTYARKTGDRNILNGNKRSEDRIQRFQSFYESVFFNSSNNLPLENWEKELLQDKDLLGFRAAYFDNFMDTEEKERLYVGPALQNILTNFETVPLKKINLFSAHDHTLYSLMKALGIWDEGSILLPPDGAALIIEHYSPLVPMLDTGSYIKFFYQNATSAKPHYLEIPKCGQPCYIGKFKEVFQKVLPQNVEEECKLTNPKSVQNSKKSVPAPKNQKSKTDMKLEKPVPIKPVLKAQAPELYASAENANISTNQVNVSALNILMGVVFLVVITGAVIFAAMQKRRDYIRI